MKISARNQLTGVVSKVDIGMVNAEVKVKFQGKDTICATVTKEAVEELGLKEGSNATAIFKASSVILAPGAGNVQTTARNHLSGKVIKVEMGLVNAEIVIELSGGEHLSAIITKEAAEELSIQIGSEITALVKAANVLIGV